MKKTVFGFAASLLILGACNKQKATLDYSASDPSLEGETLELITFGDSAVISTATVHNGHANFLISDEEAMLMPRLLTIMKDGRTKGYYIAEPGNSVLVDSIYTASGTPLNDKFSRYFQQADSVDQLDDLAMYADFVKNIYEENRDNPIGEYFGLEFIKYGSPAAIKVILPTMDKSHRTSDRAAKYIRYAELRGETAPGMKYKDFSGEDADGNKVALSDLVTPGKWTLVDFWASWCRYCIKELPELKKMHEEFADKGFDIVGVAVRDEVADTKGAVDKFGLPYTIMYNAGRTPYEIYGFSGIPHHMLISPDGTIVSRGENAAQIRARLENTLGK